MNRGYLFAGIQFGGRVYADLRWQPYLDRATDSQSHASLEANADRYPFLLLNPLGAAFDSAALALPARNMLAYSGGMIGHKWK